MSRMSAQLPNIDWVKELAYRAGILIRENFYEREKEVGASHEGINKATINKQRVWFDRVKNS